MKCEIKNGILNLAGFDGIEDKMVLIANPPDIVMYTKKQFEELCAVIDSLGGSDKANLFKRKIMSGALLCEVENGNIMLPEYFTEHIKDGEYKADFGEAYTEIKRI